MSKYDSQKRVAARTLLCAGFLLGTAITPALAAQQRTTQTPPAASTTTPAQTTEAKPKAGWSLKVTKQEPRLLTLKVKDVAATEIAAELSKQLKVPVNLSPLMQQQHLTVEFQGVTLDAALRMLAPQPYVDYELGGDQNAAPKPLAIFLYALNEPPPATNAAAKGGSEALLIEGDTEEGTEDYEKAKERGEVPLSVAYTKNQLSVHAKKQPLSVVLYKIAYELGIPFDLRSGGSETVDVNFSNYSLDQAIRNLQSPAVRFYYRADLQNFEIQPLRLVLMAPART